MSHRKKLPQGPPPELAKATALWQERRFDEALRFFKEAVRRAPNDIGVLVDAARALGARYQRERSGELLERAVRLGPRRADVQFAVGESYRMLGRWAEAEARYRDACRLGATPQAELELAKICERRHALDEAAELVNHVLHADPQSGAAMLLRARIARRKLQYDVARATLDQILSVPNQQPKVLAQAYGELCTLCDATKEYDLAWEAILRCKQLLAAQEKSVWNTAQFVVNRCSRMVDALTPAHFERWQSMADIGPPHRVALLTGFPRSGTTLLEQVLDAHPDVVSTEEKDIFAAEIFPRLGGNHTPDTPVDELLDDLSPPQILAARQLYVEDIQAILGGPIGTRMHLDKNPAMNLMIPAMKRVFPELKVLVMLRDPRDVVASCFLRYLPVNPVSVYFLTLDRTIDRYLLEIGAWLRMREMFGDWLEVRYENLVCDVRGQSQRTLAALEVPWDETVLQYRERQLQKPVRSPSYVEVSRPIFATSIGRWQNYERHLAPMLDRLAPLITALGYDS